MLYSFEKGKEINPMKNVKFIVAEGYGEAVSYIRKKIHNTDDYPEVRKYDSRWVMLFPVTNFNQTVVFKFLNEQCGTFEMRIPHNGVRNVYFHIEDDVIFLS